ncbi:hypothetical protein [Streptomyces litchfieldiae]|uniref:Uncharacterized protein n=1 Tax=Streptomyces litchfieldiae TaxID=3075543 RepID=A0ABU2MQ77_9ACTN|nr:hypothetical protein [Streptomyces sp. DSM 44938]MDT0343665.1 hypothetical protein [Streptomyces sp. DSM 44938]
MPDAPDADGWGLRPRRTGDGAELTRVHRDGAVRIDRHGSAVPLSVIAAGPLSAPNLGTSRLFAGSTAPASPQAGDVWVSYG